ncbi:L,D-transpeptidase family protein [Novosphingobium sp. ZN18A2]|uniref:L,D-transpeptidase family protein n=1 Tax=Novosphingobium sp. ZN18A2 TaxID=3079861 RepID=UPI0030D2A9F2
MFRKRALSIFGGMALAFPALAGAQVPGWTDADIAVLRQQVAAAPADALPAPSTAALDRAVASGDRAAMDVAAMALATRLARMHLLGTATGAQKAGWNIEDTDKRIDIAPLLVNALASGTLGTFFTGLDPQDPEYAALRRAYAAETDEKRRATIGKNMERWRWMPRSLGPDHVLVNAAAFQARLTRGGKPDGSWRVIVGKTSTPTPVFHTDITGVIFNPWWEVPASIVRESVGALVRRHPATARARGYVVQNGRYRQAPGPNNALGQMKLVMPNRFSVFMHDTPNRTLFERENRALSHGCVRTDDAIGYAATLLQGVKTREEIDAIVESRKTTQVDLARPMPLYIAYFTAGTDAGGAVVTYKDIYKRDVRVPAPPAANIPCTD